MLTGYYYLHTNGQLIYKRELGGTAADIRESDFAVGLWPVDPEDRESAWRLLVEGLASGADKARVMELAKQWGCDDADAIEYATRISALLNMDGNAWCATRTDFVNIQECPCGFGDTCLEALAELAKDLGYKPFKTWGRGFKDLLNDTGSLELK